jgi:hypothetical protein
MGLYRNIAGLTPGQMGVINLKDLFTPPIVQQPTTLDTQPATGGGLVLTQPSTVTMLPPGTVWSGSDFNKTAVEQQYVDLFAAAAAENQRRYDYLLATSPADLAQQGYYVTTDGYVHIYTDAAHTTNAGYLDLDVIQGIENAAGTAGTLFMHMNLPIIAKNTAGYAGGSLATDGAVTVYSTPIADVLAIPATPTGANVINDYNPPEPVTPVYTPVGDNTNTNTTDTNIPTVTKTSTETLISGNTLGIVALGLAVIGVARSKKLLLVGGLGLLYYSMSKTKTA